MKHLLAIAASLTIALAQCGADRYYSPNSKTCKQAPIAGQYCNVVQTCASGHECVDQVCTKSAQKFADVGMSCGDDNTGVAACASGLTCGSSFLPAASGNRAGESCSAHADCESKACNGGTCTTGEKHLFTTKSKSQVAGTSCAGVMGDVVPLSCCDSDGELSTEFSKKCIDNGMGGKEGWLCNPDGGLFYYADFPGSGDCEFGTEGAKYPMPRGSCIVGGAYLDDQYYMVIPDHANYACASCMSPPVCVTMDNRVFEYVVASPGEWSYTIQVTMRAEDELKWEYVDAPTPAEIGTNMIQNPANADLYRSDISDSIVLMGWYEAPTGSQVLDVFDLKYGRLFSVLTYRDPTMGSFGGFSAGANPITELTMPKHADDFVAVDFTPTAMAGRAFRYSVGAYTIEMTWLTEMSVKWEYIAAPAGEVGMSATQDVANNGLYRFDVSPDVIIVGWSEAGLGGAQLVDVFDLANNKLYTNFAMVHANADGVVGNGAFFNGIQNIVEV